ncbi:porin [Paraburkholderia pallida]|uniref:Porin n=1 Tax=Paraburkholderia pallida TaxID=2547399 RepID=A0A4P7D3P2_9BURK|nr:porin [Paraburkholderia pallida]QBR01345.1 porin [Paraburkholderia pallida]
MRKRSRLPLKRIVCAIGWTIIGGTAHAQGSVTLYGILDGGLLYTSKTLDAATGQNAGHQFSATDGGMSPTQFGLTGTEDLGAGLKARFKLESGISIMNGGFNNSNGNMFGRQAYVALDSPYGTVTAGLQFSPFFLAIYGTDPRGFSQFGSGLELYVDNVLGTGAFNANGISWASPDIYGFRGSVMLALGGSAGNFQAGRQYSASLQYENGSLLVNAAIYSGNSGGTVDTPVPSTLAYWGRTLGATYKFGIVTAKLQFVNYKVAQSFNSNIYSGGLDCYVTPQLDLNGGVYFTSDRNHTANHSIMGALGATYSVSRRTSLYAQVGVVDNHGAMDTGLSLNNALYGVQGTTIGASAGIRHTF